MRLRRLATVAGAAALIALFGGAATGATAPLSNAQKQKIIEDYLAATARLDIERAGAFLSEDFTVWFVPSARAQGLPITLKGRAAFIDFVRNLQGQPGKWKIRTITPLQFFFSDDGAAVRVRNVGDFPGGGVYDNEYVFLYRFSGDKISEMREFTDTAYIGMLRSQAEQAKANPPPAP